MSEAVEASQYNLFENWPYEAMNYCILVVLMFIILLKSRFFGEPLRYSHLSNNRGGWNKRVGRRVAEVTKSAGFFCQILS